MQVYWSNQHPNFPAGGKLSQWLESQPVGTMVEAKGPTGHFHYLGRGRYASSFLTVRVESCSPGKSRTCKKSVTFRFKWEFKEPGPQEEVCCSGELVVVQVHTG